MKTQEKNNEKDNGTNFNHVIMDDPLPKSELPTVRKCKCDDCGQTAECQVYGGTFFWVCLRCGLNRSSGR